MIDLHREQALSGGVWRRGCSAFAIRLLALKVRPPALVISLLYLPHVTELELQLLVLVVEAGNFAGCLDLSRLVGNGSHLHAAASFSRAVVSPTSIKSPSWPAPHGERCEGRYDHPWGSALP